MNWRAIHKTNARRHATKVRRESNAAANKARIAALGGPITVAEVRSATRRMETPRDLPIGGFEVWTFRGRDWLMGYTDGSGTITNVFPYVSWRSDGHDSRDHVPMTVGATRWVHAQRQSAVEA